MTVNISGHWKGHYIQTLSGSSDPADIDLVEDRYPVEAWIETRGSELSGNMIDERTTRETRFSDVVEAQASMASPAQRKLLKAFLARFPNAMYRSTLAADSKLKGKLKGRDVSFSKTYSLPQRFTWIYDGKELDSSFNGSIYYFGKVSEDGNRIEGFYRITRNPFKKSWKLKQGFVLNRELKMCALRTVRRR